jgi:hypothetical protein
MSIWRSAWAPPSSISPSRKRSGFAARMADLYTRASAEKLIVVKGSGTAWSPRCMTMTCSDRHHAKHPPDRSGLGRKLLRPGLRQTPAPTNDGGWLLLSDNPAISPITAYDGELHVLGRVVAFFRKM